MKIKVIQASSSQDFVKSQLEDGVPPCRPIEA